MCSILIKKKKQFNVLVKTALELVVGYDIKKPRENK